MFQLQDRKRGSDIKIIKFVNLTQKKSKNGGGTLYFNCFTKKIYVKSKVGFTLATLTWLLL